MVRRGRQEGMKMWTRPPTQGGQEQLTAYLRSKLVHAVGRETYWQEDLTFNPGSARLSEQVT